MWYFRNKKKEKQNKLVPNSETKNAWKWNLKLENVQ